jgi:hypothetical protein
MMTWDLEIIFILVYLCEIVIHCEGLSIFGSYIENDGYKIDDDEEENEDEEDVLDYFYFVAF